MKTAPTRMRRIVLATGLLWVGSQSPAFAQDVRAYAGGLFGVSTLSADARSVTAPPVVSVSLYKPENGTAVNAFVGVHLGRFFSVQANYIWNRNDLTLVSSFISPDGSGFYEQGRMSGQHAVIADALLYFRGVESGIRPYLSTGVGLVRFDSDPTARLVVNGIAPPEEGIRSTRVALRVAVGIDLAISSGWAFRYSFSETISGNPVSERLTPPGQRNLANFQNLFGVVGRL